MYSIVAELPRKFKIFLVLLCDVILLPLAFWSAVALREGTTNPPIEPYWWLFFLLPFFTIPIFIRLGLYRAVIRYLDDKVVYTVIYGVSLSVLVLMAVAIMGRAAGLPRSSIIIYWIIAVAYITASRFVARGVMRTLKRDKLKQRVAIYGAGRAGLQTAVALISGSEFQPVAFFDDNKNLHGASLLGIRVYSPDKAIKILQEQDCNQLLLAIPSTNRQRRKEIIQKFEGTDITLKTLPGLGELVHGTVRIEDIRDVGVEDLLGRDPVPPHMDLISACIKDKAVMVTGAGGSIGSELCRQILKQNPKKLVLLEQNEYGLYKIEQELIRLGSKAIIVPVLGNVLNKNHLTYVMQSHAIETVYHAAAYKHVPLVEGNITAGVMNNVFGTLYSAQAAIECSVHNFVLISTDKAVRPTNVMGASKRLAELVLQALSTSPSLTTRFCMVRFGNVLGSSGSVVPLFKEQIKNGGPITVTHPEVTRFFMTIPEAAQLVLQAGAMSKGGDVFVLDMGEPEKIVDLAKKMIKLSGLELREDGSDVGDIAIEFIGLRPGEKLYEELLIGDNVAWTEHPRIMRAKESSLDNDFLAQQLEILLKHCTESDHQNVKDKLHELVEGYIETKTQLSNANLN